MNVLVEQRKIDWSETWTWDLQFKVPRSTNKYLALGSLPILFLTKSNSTCGIPVEWLLTLTPDNDMDIKERL